MPDLARELRQVHIVPLIGYCVLGALIVLGTIMIAWYPLATLICGKRYDGGSKTHTTVIQPTTAPTSVTEVHDSEVPLMFKGQRKDVEAQQPTVQYDFDKEGNERFS